MSHPTVQTPAIAIGTRLTDFATLDLTVEGLAEGGMGLVVWGKNAAQGNQMTALKLLRPDRVAAAAVRSPAQRQAIERQFEEEALVWCHLWHHQCVIIASGLTRLPALDDLPVLVLEYVPNGSVRDLMRRGRAQRTHPSLQGAMAWAIQIASALAHIHQPDPDHDRPAPLVHCDLKPENVLFHKSGWAQLTDLGLTRTYAAITSGPVEVSHAVDPSVPSPSSAAALNPTAHQSEVATLRAILQAAGALPPDQSEATASVLLATRTMRIPPTHAPPAALPASAAVPAIGALSPVAGTPPYMAPEQWLGLDAAVPATDLYAFAVLLFELFAGTESPHPYPFDPTSFLTPDLYAHALTTGYDPALLAWHAAHTAPAGPVHHITDPDVAEAALRSGPLAELAHRGGDAAGRAAAHEALQQLDALISACLAPNPAIRPSAATAQQRLAALALGPCGLDPIQTPMPVPSTPQEEASFWDSLGMTYSNFGRQEKAIAARRRGIQHDATNPDIWFNLGASLGKRAQQELQEAAAAGHGEQAVALTGAARQHFEESLAAFQHAEAIVTPDILEDDPAFPAQTAANQAVTLSNLGRYAEAVAADQRALAFQPEWHDTRVNLAIHFARWSQSPDASSDERASRLMDARREIEKVLAAAPGYTKARLLAERIARALADPAHRFHG